MDASFKTERHNALDLPATGVARSAKSGASNPDDTLRAALADCASEAGGPVSARARAAALGARYLQFGSAERVRVLELLATEFGPDPKSVAKAHTLYAKAVGTPEQWDAEARLRQAITSPRSKILRQFNELPDGLKFLVDLRVDVLNALDKHPNLGILDRELQARLASWFDVGFLEMRRLSWDTPAALLEKLIEYEAVHHIQSWTDLKNRLDSDRRCYAFFHPRMPREPLIFVEIALTHEISGDIQVLLDEKAPLADVTGATTAIFYSISNTQSGLRGISFGNFLLKRVIEALQRDFPHLDTFCTLSPLPGFRGWLDAQFIAQSLPITAADVKPLAALVGEKADPMIVAHVLQRTRWSERPDVVAALAQPMGKLCLHYLTGAKQGRYPLDPVARFHLGNGARVERLNWAADISVKGFNQSYSMMVNYRYLPEALETNVDAYGVDGHIALAPEFGD